MIELLGLIGVGLAWGICTSFLEQAGQYQEYTLNNNSSSSDPSAVKEKCKISRKLLKLVKSVVKLVLNYRFFIPYICDQIASGLYYYLLGHTKLILAVSLSNCSSFVSSYFAEKAIKSRKQSNEFVPITKTYEIHIEAILGAIMVIIGAVICITSL